MNNNSIRKQSHHNTLLLCLPLLLVLACPMNGEDVMMWRLYHALQRDIWQASYGTDIPEAYLATIISLESYPPGNQHSKRFEKHIYQRLLKAKQNRQAFGNISWTKLRKYNDSQLRQFATSYGLTQIMGYHCLQIGCSIEELSGPYHLQWAITWMEKKYGKYARRGDFQACLRIHNTGRPNGRTYHKNYVQKGLRRIDYYNKWKKRKGQFF